MAELTLNHHASLWLSANTKDILEPLGASVRHVTLLLKLGRMWPRRWLNGHPRFVLQIKATIIPRLDNLHVLVENVQRGIGLAKKLLATSHPVLVSALFLLKVDGSSRSAIKLLYGFHDVFHLPVHWTLTEIGILALLV